MLPDHMIGEYLVQQGGSVLNVVLHVRNVRLVEAIAHSLQSCISFTSIGAGTSTHVPGQIQGAEFVAQWLSLPASASAAKAFQFAGAASVPAPHTSHFPAIDDVPSRRVA